MMTHTKLAEAYFRLTSLKEHIGRGDVKEKHVEIFNDTLKDLESLPSPYDLSCYYIPAAMMRRKLTGSGIYPEPSETYSEESYCDGAYFRIQLDTVLLLFTFPEEKAPIGFRPPQ